MPELVQTCIASWRTHMPNWEYRLWSEDNFDIDSAPQYVREAYEAKKFAFVSDYVRLWALEQEGGVYLDTDVELVKPLDDLLHNQCFMGIDTTFLVSNGLGLGAEKGNDFIKENIAFYDNLNLSELKKPLVNSPITTDLLRKKGELNTENGEIQYIGEITIYPPEYFCAKHTHTGEIVITPNTYAIHHFTLSWASEEERENTLKRWNKYKIERIKRFPKLLLRKFIGDSTVDNIKRIIFKK
jgi:hypothetical protein